MRAHTGGDLQPHAEAEASVAHLLLDRLEQVAGLVLFDLDVGVARDAEGWHSMMRIPGKSESMYADITSSSIAKQ